MRSRKILAIITICITILSALASAAGIYKGERQESRTITSVWGEEIKIDGRGLYAQDSISIASQGRAQDIVTMIIGIPLLLISFILHSKGKLKGSLLYGGTLAYFLYTYMSYCFLVIFNPIFPVYTMLFTLSLIGLVLLLCRLDIKVTAAKMAPHFYRKTISIYLFVTGLLIFLMWTVRIVPAILNGTPPFGIDHYSSLSIQVMDLSVVVPVSIITSILLWRKQPWGYVLSAIIVFKALSLLLAIFAMIISEYGNPINPVETLIFLALIAANLGFTVLVFRSVPVEK